MKRKKSKQNLSERRGQMRPFTSEQVNMLHTLLSQDDREVSIRDLALLRVGIDTMLRSSDMLSLRLRDVCPNGELASSFRVYQKKTDKPVDCEIGGKARAALSAYLALKPDLSPEDRIFPICRMQHHRILKEWCRLLKLDPKLYGTHSVRRTKAAFVYQKTKNIKALKDLLGHQSVQQTQEYLGVSREESRAIARQYEM